MKGQRERSEAAASNELPPRPALVMSMSAPPGKVPLLPLQDISQYADAYVPPAALPAHSTTLAGLAHVVRFQAYQEERRSQLRLKLHRSLESCALSARLARCGELAHRSLVDSFRSDDKKTFAALYNALHNVRDSCNATRQYALLEPDLVLGKTRSSKAHKNASFSTFMDELPTRTREDLLKFISKIRTNPEFLASRLANLSPAELSSLSIYHQNMEPIESVMPFQPRGRASLAAAKRNNAQGPSPVERLLAFQRRDPLSALLHTVFANSTGPDSSEDLRRTEVWATACARLIAEGKPGSEQFICTVLNTWAAMREWPAKGNLELYFMHVLQDGAFLLEKSEQQPNGSKPIHETRSTKETIAAEEFYDRSVKRLFEVIDDEPSAGGIPDGVLELGNAIIRKLEDPKKQRAAQTFIVSRWFFSTFLLNTIIHPESRGIMAGHHISEYARQKILKEIAVHAQNFVLDMTYNWKQAAPILPEIRVHIESILARFRSSRVANTKPTLLPAKVVTSPRETVEVQPFLVVCPADMITLVNALFPERRPPTSSLEKDPSSKGLNPSTRGLKSAGSSTSGVSLPLNLGSGAHALDSLSLLSHSNSSDSTSREPLLNSTKGNLGGNTASSAFTSNASREGPREHPPKGNLAEEYARRLRSALSEMTRILGPAATAGTCHPCAEQWAVLYVSPDGRELMTRMRKDYEEEEDDDDDSSDDEGTDKPNLGSDYHQLKESIFNLIEEYEIPKELAPESESKGFSNRASTVRKSPKKGLSSSASFSDTAVSKNPYHAQTQPPNSLPVQKQAVPERHRPQHDRASSRDAKATSTEPPQAVLITMLEAAMTQCQTRGDFVPAQVYHRTLLQVRAYASSSLARNGYSPLLQIFALGPRESIERSASAIEEFEAWFVWLKQSQERHDGAIEDMMTRFKDLRDKMWYVTDVKNSATFEEAKNIAVALNIMGQPQPPGNSAQPKARHIPKPTNNDFLLKIETQVMDLLAAPYEQGGPNKLSDEQSEMTHKWLSRLSIENFCKGEERIHRFCLEVYKCVSKLVAENIMDGPVLWSSELFSRDKKLLDSGRETGDLFLTGVGTLSIAGDEEYELEAGRSNPKPIDFAGRPNPRDLGSISARNASQLSFESGRRSIGRTSAITDIMDSQDYSMSTPSINTDSTPSFWSPFQSNSKSPSSASSIRPRSPSSTNDTFLLKSSESVNDEKRRFLLDLRQTLTGLILSDLGMLVWSHGCETDSWFGGELGEECILRKEEQERSSKRKKALSRKRSTRGLKNTVTTKLEPPRFGPLGVPERSQPAAPVATLEHAAPDFLSAEDTSSSSDAVARSFGLSAAKKAGLLEFPYNVAFRRLLSKFSTHPNPFIKLHALYELELLIVASLMSRSSRPLGTRSNTLPATPSSPTLGAMGDLTSHESTVNVGRAKNLKEAIANCEERRMHTLGFGGIPSSFRGIPSGRSNNGPPSTDMIVEVLQGLFRDSDIRPKTLFRDLQFIASFVPAQILDKTERGKAFWDTALAALGLKQDVCRMMVEIADEVVIYHTRNRGPANVRHPEEVDDLGRFSMEDAAKMWTITAKEGDPVAERELASLYLTHNNLLPNTILPLTKPMEVFKPHMMQRGKKEDPTRLDPATMCVAVHWMELASQGGDELARKYLRVREEFNPTT
ncbi:MAG: hypothetical protein M1829_000247 [Trizodia sp. TS-e1964]|nr:MAG: hypothetical protein M1829_000247 [Trizodia sp. TS-e1964]